MDISKSMPMIKNGTYTPDWAKSNESNAEFLSALKENKQSKVATYEIPGISCDLLKVRLLNTDFYYVTGIIDGQELIVYGVETEAIKTRGLHDIHTLSQVSVWRNPDYGSLFRFASWVFYKILIPINGNILSDEVQSRDGKHFWATQITDALLNQNLHIYALGINKSKYIEEVIPIHNVLDIDAHYTKEPNGDGKYYRLFITTKLLREKHK